MAFALFKGLFGGGDIYGKKPKVPQLEPTTREAITSNINLIPDLEKLAEAFNALSQESLNKQFDEAMPGYSRRLDELGEITDDLLSGEYPDKVQAAAEEQVSRTTAASNFKMRVAGSPFGASVVGWNRGQIPISAFGAGLSTLKQWTEMGKARLAPSLNLGSFMISKEEQFNRNWQANLIKAAPSPTARGQFDTEMGILGMVLGAYSGGSYQGTYKPNYGGGGVGGDGGSSPTYQPGGIESRPTNGPYNFYNPVTPLPNTAQPTAAESDRFNFGMF